MTAANPVVGPDGHVDVDVLSELVEGLLDDAARAEAEAHIAACDDCRETYAALVEVRDLLGAQPAEPMPEDVYAGIQSALADAARQDAPPAEPRPLDLGALPPPSPPSRPERPSAAP
ncbi:MAG: hypothetical protein HOV68_28760, partial [Streptomycetaceae bacterium]|nr:hypothetical protein [Streptomycetaceae bacterium]